MLQEEQAITAKLVAQKAAAQAAAPSTATTMRTDAAPIFELLADGAQEGTVALGSSEGAHALRARKDSLCAELEVVERRLEELEAAPIGVVLPRI